jgi:hypothetical protein
MISLDGRLKNSSTTYGRCSRCCGWPVWKSVWTNDNYSRSRCGTWGLLYYQKVWLPTWRICRLNSIGCSQGRNTSGGASSSGVPPTQIHCWICEHHQTANPTNWSEVNLPVLNGGKTQLSESWRGLSVWHLSLGIYGQRSSLWTKTQVTSAPEVCAVTSTGRPRTSCFSQTLSKAENYWATEPESLPTLNQSIFAS